MRVGSLFSGIGLLDYGLHLAGLEHSWLCEVDPWRREILTRRFPGAHIFDDVRAVGSASAGPVDVIAGGFPCKGASTAGKRTGFDHPGGGLSNVSAGACMVKRCDCDGYDHITGKPGHPLAASSKEVGGDGE